MENIIEELERIRNMVKERNRFLQEVANLIVQAASVGLDHVDSQVLLSLMDQHQKKVSEILEGTNATT